MVQTFKALTGINDIKPLQSHGIMSNALTGKCKGKDVVITICKLNSEQIRQKIWRKPILFSKLVEHAGVHYPKVYKSVFEKGYSILITERLAGMAAGQRKLSDGIFQDLCFAKGIDKSLTRQMKRIHSIQLERFGVLKTTRGGTFKTWNGFLLSQIRRNFSYLRKKSAYFKLTKADQEAIECLLTKVKYLKKPVLLHGDITNYSNILVQDGKVTGIVDVEWSLAGDPAYDFIDFNSPFQLSQYTSSAAFWRRREIYRIFWLLWGCTVHPDNAVGKALYHELRQQLGKVTKR